MSSPSPPADICNNLCTYSFDGYCDDGGAGAETALCEIGTDCIDCGPRTVVPASLPPPAKSDSILYIAAIAAISMGAFLFLACILNARTGRNQTLRLIDTSGQTVLSDQAIAVNKPRTSVGGSKRPVAKSAGEITGVELAEAEEAAGGSKPDLDRGYSDGARGSTVASEI